MAQVLVPAATFKRFGLSWAPHSVVRLRKTDKQYFFVRLVGVQGSVLELSISGYDEKNYFIELCAITRSFFSERRLRTVLQKTGTSPGNENKKRQREALRKEVTSLWAFVQHFFRCGLRGGMIEFKY